MTKNISNNSIICIVKGFVKIYDENIFGKISKSIFGLIVKTAMAIPLEIGICNLLSKLFAYAFILFNHLNSARTISAAGFETFFD